MATWQPPIPGGALTSKPARQLGSALVLLAWCYEAVRREDCALDLHLTEAAADLEESYHTIKKWWAAIRTGPWFAEVTDRGKSGYRIRMADDWLDWRTFKAASKRGQVPETVLEETDNEGPIMALEDLESAVKERSRNGQVPETVLHAPAYKVLITDQDSNDSFAPRKARTRKPKVPSDETTPAEIRKAIATVCHAESSRMLIRVNTVAKAIWARQLARGFTVLQTAEAVPKVAGYLASSVYPYSKGQPIKPEALDDHWLAAAEAAKDTTNGHRPTNQQPLRQPITRDANGFEWGTRAARNGHRSADRHVDGLPEMPRGDPAPRDKGEL